MYDTMWERHSSKSRTGTGRVSRALAGRWEAGLRPSRHACFVGIPGRFVARLHTFPHGHWHTTLALAKVGQAAAGRECRRCARRQQRSMLSTDHKAEIVRVSAATWPRPKRALFYTVPVRSPPVGGRPAARLQRRRPRASPQDRRRAAVRPQLLTCGYSDGTAALLRRASFARGAEDYLTVQHAPAGGRRDGLG
eukprot:SAG25_NODE_702_length_5870_cov_4.999653_5_plen_194_part_00